MLKYRADTASSRLFSGAGVTVRHTNDFNNVPSFLFNGLNGVGARQTPVGFVAGGGVRFRMGPIDVTPELRYTRWNSNSLSKPYRRFCPSVRTKLRSW